MDAVSEIKARIAIEDLVSQYVQLKKVGRNFKALCPFHKERTPSFYVNPERQLAYCFGCRKGGDHFKFIEEIEGLDFVGALKFLAEKAGVTLPKAVPQNKEKKSERDRLIVLHEEAARFFEKQLFETPDGKKVLDYLKKRGLKEETVKSARLGFASDEKTGALYSHLLGAGFKRPEILSAGLAVARDTSLDACVDRFRMRLMFPIQNLAGGICAFGGRAIREGDEPKYLNSPETPIFHKSSFLYGLAQGRAEIRRKNSAVIVEGYMDALAAHQAGITNAVACGGTALTEDQLNILKRFAKELIFAFDRDDAGKLATERAIELALSKEFSLRVAVWESKAKDPDECIRKDPKVFFAAAESAAPAMSYLFRHFQESSDKTVLGKKQVIDKLLPFLSQIKSPVELDGWIKEVSVICGASLSSIYDELKRFQGKQKMPIAFKSASASSTVDNFSSISAKGFKGEEYLLGLLLTYPEAYAVANQIVTPEYFGDIELQNIYRSLTTQYNQTLDDHERERANILAMLSETLHSDMTWEAIESEVKQSAFNLVRQKLDREKRSLVAELRTVSGKDKEKLIEQYQELLAREDSLLGR